MCIDSDCAIYHFEEGFLDNPLVMILVFDLYLGVDENAVEDEASELNQIVSDVYEDDVMMTLMMSMKMMTMMMIDDDDDDDDDFDYDDR
jgi:hypothetical protein